MPFNVWYNGVLPLTQGEGWPTTFEMSPVVGEIIQPSEYAALQEAKAEITKWFRVGEEALFHVVDVVLRIEREGLYRFDFNQDTGEPYHSMREYYPHLLGEIKESSGLHRLSESLVRVLVRLDKVFVQGLGIPREQILEEGVSRYTAVAEAIDYNHHSGEVNEMPRQGKLGKDEALQILQQARDEGWSLQSLTEELDEKRGVQRRYAHIDWLHEYTGSDGKMYSVGRIVVSEGNTSYDSGDSGLTLELARWVTKKLGAISNLPKEEEA